MSGSTRRRVPAYALLIGVNGAGLHAPEPDALKLRNVLATLGIPFASIDVLANRTATRQNIIKSLRSIADNPQILSDAPIIIHFAGHGTQTAINIPKIGTRKVECIVPFDSLSKQAPPIPDITISALLGRIARKKSKYITLFLDCCHSGSGSRGDSIIDTPTSETDLEPSPELVFESVNPDIFAQLDGELWSDAIENAAQDPDSNSRALSTNSLSFRYSGVTSHVLIASCHETEKSLEYSVNREPRSLFTSALIKALDECKEDRVLWSITHTALFERVKGIMLEIYQENSQHFRHSQTPQCEGYIKTRPVFSTPAAPHASHAIAPIAEHAARGAYLLPVGSLTGVSPQSTFEIYDFPNGTSKLVSKTRVAPGGLSPVQTLLNAGRDLELGPDAYAVMCTAPVALPVDMVGEFPALYSDQGFQRDLVKLLGDHEPMNHFIVPVRNGHAYKLRASYSRNQGVVELKNMYGSALRIRRPSRVPDALAKAVVFFHHLDLPNLSPAHNDNMFSVQIHELAEAATNDWSAIDHRDVDTLVLRQDRQPIPMHPTGGCIVPAPQNPDTVFGLRIQNRGSYNFYVYVFYFDPSDFSITPIYMPPSTLSHPTLLSRGELAVGYSDSGAAPLSFSIDERLEKDTGFIKIYYSMIPTDMSAIKQDGFNESLDSRPANPYYSSASGPFGSIVYPVTVTNPRHRH